MVDNRGVTIRKKVIKIALVLLLIGALIWALVGISLFDVVAQLASGSIH
ncbi:DUF378 domain-containing protein [Sporosarcina sp. JAI121]